MGCPAQVLKKIPQKWLWLLKHQSGCIVDSVGGSTVRKFKWLLVVCVGMHVGMSVHVCMCVLCVGWL